MAHTPFILEIFTVLLIMDVVICRPHPNECSGGDLDGDLYFVCWDRRLVPDNTDTPMDYTARRPRIMDHDVTLEACLSNFYLDLFHPKNLYKMRDSVVSISHLMQN